MTRQPHVIEIDKLILHGVDRLDARSVEMVRRQVQADVMAAVSAQGADGDHIGSEAGASVAQALRTTP